MSNETFVVLWSNRQKSFHINTLGEMIEENLRAFHDGRSSDYVVLGIADSYREAAEMIVHLDRLQIEAVCKQAE